MERRMRTSTGANAACLAATLLLAAGCVPSSRSRVVAEGQPPLSFLAVPPGRLVLRDLTAGSIVHTSILPAVEDGGSGHARLYLLDKDREILVSSTEGEAEIILLPSIRPDHRYSITYETGRISHN
jgi:hypothetical protein